MRVFILYLVSAIILLVAAIVILGVAQLGLMRALGRQQSEFKQTGFYRFSRNPQIVGCAFYGIGFAILWPSWYALGWLLLFAPLAHIMVLVEEEHLRETSFIISVLGTFHCTFKRRNNPCHSVYLTIRTNNLLITILQKPWEKRNKPGMR